jgi:hypothetical protein
LNETRIQELVDEINEEARKLQTALCDKIGVESYIKINGEDRIFELANYETACHQFLQSSKGNK